MPPKRPKAEGVDPKAGRKRARLVDARSVVVQSSEAALVDGRLDVPAFVSSRKFEIEQLESAIVKSKATAKQRAFQMLPRTLRRRTASHNVKRVPRRIRERALHEMTSDNTPPRSMSERARKMRGHDRVKAIIQSESLGKVSESEELNVDQTTVDALSERPLGKPKYRSRQKSKTWLPTHVWHVKRAHMENLWGYSIPCTPTQKCYRSTHRTSSHVGCMAWDKSYSPTIILVGRGEQVKGVVHKLTLSNAAIADFYTSGKRAWEGFFRSSDTNVIGPGLIYYQPDSDETSTTLLIRIHPAMFEALSRLIVKYCKEASVSFHDCRYSIGSIQLLGSKSTDVLQSVLHPVDPTSHASKAWKQLSGLANASSLPQGAAITLDVHDPRLFYPPKKPSVSKLNNIVDIPAEWPDYMAGHSGLLSIDGRSKSYEGQSSLKKINRRRTLSAPGIHLSPQPEDPSIPVILLRHSYGDGWTLLAPWGWILPFWFSVMHYPSISLGGYMQEHQMMFERGAAFFPNDFPGSVPGHKLAWSLARVIKSQWERRPPAKRIAYHAVQTADGSGEHGDPFRCDWDYLVKTRSRREELQEEMDYNSDNPGSLPVHHTAAGARPAIKQVSIKYVQRGSPDDLARIYEIPDDDLASWTRLNTTLESSYPVCPSSKFLIGYVTTGNFNLSDGAGTAVGSVLVTTGGFVEPLKGRFYLVRNVGTSICRLARLDAI